MINVTQKRKHYVIGINHYLTRCLLVIELINNDIMWWYSLLIPRFFVNEICGFFLKFWNLVIFCQQKKGYFEEAIVLVPKGPSTWYSPWQESLLDLSLHSSPPCIYTLFTLYIKVICKIILCFCPYPLFNGIQKIRKND